jgi:hypothetical protein
MPDARQLVRSIAKEHGFLGEDVYSRMEPDLRREVEEAMLNKDKLIGSSVMTYVYLFLSRLRSFSCSI